MFMKDNTQTIITSIIDFEGNFDTHYGIMPNCGIKMPFSSSGGECCSGNIDKKEKEEKYDYKYEYYPQEYYIGYDPWNYNSYYSYGQPSYGY